MAVMTVTSVRELKRSVNTVDMCLYLSPTEAIDKSNDETSERINS